MEFLLPCIEYLCVRGVGPSYSKYSPSFREFYVVQIKWLPSLVHISLPFLNNIVLSYLWSQISYPFGLHEYFLGHITNAYPVNRELFVLMSNISFLFFCQYAWLLLGTDFIPSWVKYKIIFWFQTVHPPTVICRFLGLNIIFLWTSNISF